MTEVTVDTTQGLLTEAVLYIYNSHANPEECPWCGWSNGTKSNKEKAFQAHIRSSHEHKSIMAYEQQTLVPRLIENNDRVREETVEERLGLEILDEVDKVDFLAIDPDVRREAEAKGDVLRWASPDKVSYWRNQGGEPVPFKGENYMKKQNSTEDGLQKSNEMMLFQLPKTTVDKRRAVKARKTEDQLRSRAEERVGNHPDDIKEQAYQGFLADGLPREVAQQRADSLGRGLERGNIRQREGVREGFMHIRDQRGERSL